jgi:hypothetical protein
MDLVGGDDHGQGMATKGDRFRVAQERAAQDGRPKRVGYVSAGKRAAERGRRMYLVPNPAAHNDGARAARKSNFELEISATTRPSRKSTRKSTTRIKPDSSLRLAAVNRSAAPSARAASRGGTRR